MPMGEATDFIGGAALIEPGATDVINAWRIVRARLFECTIARLWPDGLLARSSRARDASTIVGSLPRILSAVHPRHYPLASATPPLRSIRILCGRTHDDRADRASHAISQRPQISQISSSMIHRRSAFWRADDRGTTSNWEVELGRWLEPWSHGSPGRD